MGNSVDFMGVQTPSPPKKKAGALRSNLQISFNNIAEVIGIVWRF